MKARITNPARLLPDTLTALLAAGKAAKTDSVPAKTLSLIHLRASQINGCSFCVDMHARELKGHGETDQRIFAVSAWREAPFYNDAERAALDLAECATRLSDRPDPVPDAVWQEAARHFDETGLAVITLHIALVNLWNRVNVTTRQLAGQYPG